jgi:2-polyprenyl-3-methyl-5-hydroxy-6-metoxy-1,4-benzoquinol methylase
MLRHRVHELMDDPTISPADHAAALAGLRRINRTSNVAPRLLRPILEFARRRGQPDLRLLDVACGGGDVPVALALLLRKAGVNAHLTFFDQSAFALERATALARESDVETSTLSGDALTDFSGHSFDVVTNSLFLHHLDGPQVVMALDQMRRATQGLLVISDLRRSRLALAVTQVGCRLLSRSPIVHYDGPASVRAAWTADELRDFARRADLARAVITHQHPFRLLLTWENR